MAERDYVVVQEGAKQTTVDVWAKFRSLISPMFGGIETTRKESRSLAAQRDTLLPLLVSGEVRMNGSDSNGPSR